MLFFVLFWHKQAQGLKFVAVCPTVVLGWWCRWRNPMLHRIWRHRFEGNGCDPTVNRQNAIIFQTVTSDPKVTGDDPFSQENILLVVFTERVYIALLSQHAFSKDKVVPTFLICNTHLRIWKVSPYDWYRFQNPSCPTIKVRKNQTAAWIKSNHNHQHLANSITSIIWIHPIHFKCNQSVQRENLPLANQWITTTLKKEATCAKKKMNALPRLKDAP